MNPHLVLPLDPAAAPSRRLSGRRLMRQILVPVLLALAAIVLLLALVARQHLARTEQQHTRELGQQAQSLWLRLLEDESRRLRWLADRAELNPALQQAMRRGDAAALRAAAQPEFDSMRREFGVSHWYFIDMQQRVLLRMHDAERAGDLVRRKTLQDAARLGLPTTGVELGTTAAPTLRHVLPWRVDGHLVGYIELGTEVGWFARRIGELLGIEVASAVHKRYTSEQDFLDGSHALAFSGHWADYEDLAVLNQSLARLPAALMQAWQELARGGSDSGVMELHDGRQVWSASLLPLYDNRGRPVASLALLDDVSAARALIFKRWAWMAGGCLLLGLLLLGALYWRVRHVARELVRADRLVRVNEERFRDFASAASDWWFWEMDAQLRFTYLSPNSGHVTGRPVETLLGRSSRELVQELPPGEHADWAAHLEDLDLHRPIQQYEFRLVLPGGETRWISISGVPVFAEDGSFAGYRGTGNNVSKRKQVELQLRLAATAFEAQEGMFVADAGRIILQVNQAFSDITGYSAAEAVGQTPLLLSAGCYPPSFIDGIVDILIREGRWQGELQSRRKNGEIYPQWLTVTAVRDARGAVGHYVGLFSDITARKAAEAEIERLAFYDPLTSLPNRRLLLDRLQQALGAAQRSGRGGALLLIDLDNFKTLNDTRGHDYGDLLLKQVAERIGPCLSKTDTVARLGGDEFIVIIDELSEDPLLAASEAETVGTKLLEVLTQTYVLLDHEHHCTASIGIAMYGGGASLGLDDLMKQADLAMYQSKAAGRNAIRFFDPTMQSAASARAELDADMRKGLLRQEFVLHYQPQVDARGRVLGAEALLRWQHPTRGLVGPLDFIPAAEQSGLILPLGLWVMEQACRQLAAWAEMPAMAHLSLAVNVSARQFQQPDFVTQVQRVLARTGAKSQLLKLELTESVLMNDVESMIAKMGALQACGVGISLDDFGVGYSSLTYLKRLPLDQLKIDQSFVRNVLTERHDAAIVRAIVALARSLGLEVVAEGVETEAQRAYLLTEGCESHQGYLFSRPVPLVEFERLHQASRSAP